jgi:putative ABC transport system permease protein
MRKFPITEAMPVIEQVRGEYASVRLAGAVLSFASGLALFLSAIGLYGVLAFVVSRRTREIGIRMAIGALPNQVAGLFLKQGFVLVAAGSAAGLVLALATTRLLSAWLYGVPPRDPATFLTGSAVLAVMALLACYLPARRASRIQPLEALRYE